MKVDDLNWEDCVRSGSLKVYIMIVNEICTRIHIELSFHFLIKLTDSNFLYYVKLTTINIYSLFRKKAYSWAWTSVLIKNNIFNLYTWIAREEGREPATDIYLPICFYNSMRDEQAESISEGMPQIYQLTWDANGTSISNTGHHSER